MGFAAWSLWCRTSLGNFRDDYPGTALLEDTFLSSSESLDGRVLFVPDAAREVREYLS
ncbi:hypothetical protein [Garicola koreensis]|uniref:Uncharacterized protein n=1 Tax=Garicola koreensis TaxID=1262554 RepID=A0A7W5TQ02_9MICC|nr:hypothetical protein [Garicola koreensis]MBB3667571.1 hypothetical protein [Garicola koreensis]